MRHGECSNGPRFVEKFGSNRGFICGRKAGYFVGGFFFHFQKLCLDLQYDASSDLMGNLEADRQSKRVRLSSVMKNGVLLLRGAV